MMNTHNLKFKSQLGAADDEALLMTRQIINEANTLDEKGTVRQIWLLMAKMCEKTNNKQTFIIYCYRFPYLIFTRKNVEYLKNR